MVVIELLSGGIVLADVGDLGTEDARRAGVDPGCGLAVDGEMHGDAALAKAGSEVTFTSPPARPSRS